MAIFMPSLSQLGLGSPMLFQVRPLGHMKNSRTWHQAFSIPVLLLLPHTWARRSTLCCCLQTPAASSKLIKDAKRILSPGLATASIPPLFYPTAFSPPPSGQS